MSWLHRVNIRWTLVQQIWILKGAHMYTFGFKKIIQIISWSTGQIYTKFSPYGRYIFVDYFSDYPFPMTEGTLLCQAIYGKNRQNRPTYFHSLPWHSKTELNTAIPIPKVSFARIWLYHGNIWWTLVQKPPAISSLVTFAWRHHC